MENSQYRTFSTLNELMEALHAIEFKDKVKFVHQYVSKSFGSDEWMERIQGKVVMWEQKESKLMHEGPIVEFNGVPFVVLGRQQLECSNGKYRGKKKPKNQSPNRKKYVTLKKSIKLCCPATVIIKELLYFPGFAIPANTKARRRSMSFVLRDALLKNADKLKTERCFVTRFPGIDSHRNHDITLMSTMRQSIDKRLQAKIGELVDAGICRSGELKQHLHNFVCSELFAGRPPPPPTDTRFWPSVKTLLSVAYRARNAKKKQTANSSSFNAQLNDEDGDLSNELEGDSRDDALNSDANRETLRLKLPVQVLELLPQMMACANSILHINTTNDHGNPVKLQCTLDISGHVVFDLEGEKLQVYEVTGQSISCSVATLEHPAFLMTNDISAEPDVSNIELTDNVLESLIVSAEQQSAVELAQQQDGMSNFLSSNDFGAPDGVEQPRSQRIIHCDICGKPVLRKRIVAHRRMVHKIGVLKPPPSLKCIYCPRRCYEPMQLQTHLKYHSGEPLAVCLLCHKTFVDEFIAEAHILHVHCADYRYHCDECGLGFWKNSTMQQHVCIPENRDVNVERHRTHSNTMTQLQQLNEPLYAVVNPFIGVTVDTAIGGFVWLCFGCQKPFFDFSNYSRHQCAVRMVSCRFCGLRFINERQMNGHVCSANFTTDCLTHMCVAVPQSDNIAEIIAADRALFEDYESDDGQIYQVQPSARKRRKPKLSTAVAAETFVANGNRTETAEPALPSSQDDTADGRKRIKPKRRRLEVGVGGGGDNNVDAAIERFKRVAKRKIRRRRLPQKSKLHKNVLHNDGPDYSVIIQQVQTSNTSGSCDKTVTDEDVKVFMSPHGTRKRKICFVALANGTLQPKDEN